jgi:hypothetical protein
MIDLSEDKDFCCNFLLQDDNPNPKLFLKEICDIIDERGIDGETYTIYCSSPSTKEKHVSIYAFELTYAKTNYLYFWTKKQLKCRVSTHRCVINSHYEPEGDVKEDVISRS